MARDKFRGMTTHDLKLQLVSNKSTDSKIYNLLIVLEVVALLVGGVDEPFQ